MIKHIVFFRLKETIGAGNKSAQLNELKDRIMSLSTHIKEIENIEVGINFSDREVAYDLALISDFKSKKDLGIYKDHPEHQKLIAYLREIVKDIAGVDYIY